MSNLPKPIMSPEELVGVGAPVGELGDGVLDPAAMRARPIPRISIQAFCENGATAEIMQIAAEDRRLAKTHVSVHMGGIEAAVAALLRRTRRRTSSSSRAACRAITSLPSSIGWPRTATPGTKVRGHRPRQRRDALPRAAEARRQRVSGRARSIRCSSWRHLQPLQQSGHRAGRPCLRVHRRQGRRRLVDDLPQRGLDACRRS